MIRHRTVDSGLLRVLWPAEVQHAPRMFDQCTGNVVTALFEHLKERDYERVWLLFDALATARKQAREEFQLASIENGYAMGAAMAAETAINERQFAKALEIARLGWAALDDRNERRANAGLTAKPGSEARGLLLTSIADSKWRADGDELQNEIISQIEQPAVYLWCHESLDSALANGLIDETRHRTRALNLLWTGLWVAVCLFRYLPAILPSVIRRLNSTHSALGLSGSFRTDSASTPLLVLLESASPWTLLFDSSVRWVKARHAHSTGSDSEAKESAQESIQLHEALLVSLAKNSSSADSPNMSNSSQEEVQHIRRTLKQWNLRLSMVP